MFKTRKRTGFDGTWWNAFMRKFLLCVTIVALAMTFSIPAFAAEIDGFSYSGSSYWATVKYGLNLRDKDGDVICYLKANTNVYVLGVYKNDSSRVVVEYGNTVGTVLNVGLKKSSNQSNEMLRYSGKSYYGKVKYYLNVRDGKNNIIGKITKDEVVHVLGIYKENSSRVVIEYGNTVGTVLKAGLVEVFYSGKSYYAVNPYGLNMRDTEGNLICYIPKNSLLSVKGVYTKDNSRVVVEYNGREGNVLKGGVLETKNAVFVNIDSQKATLIRSGKIIAESKCVTGTRDSEDTPKGAFSITQKHTNKVFWPSGKQSDFWLRFYRGCGFHDAKWRSYFGGNIYKTNGSNGCVNLPHKFAKTLYENAYVGMPVYIA